jgi:hypothetical protein
MVKILHIHAPKLKINEASLLRPLLFPHLEILDLSMVNEIEFKNLAKLATLKTLHTVITRELGYNSDESLPFQVIEHPPPGRKSALNQMVDYQTITIKSSMQY